MNAFIALVRKDLALFLQDRRALLLNLLAPVLIGAFFGFLFGGGGNAERSRIEIAVVDLDHSPTSQRIAAGLQADPALRVQRLDPAGAEQAVRAGRLSAAIELPPGFGRQAGPALFGAGPRPRVRLIHDPSQGMVLPLLRGLLTEQAMKAVSAEAFSPRGSTLADLRRGAQQDPSLSAQARADLLAMFDSIARVQATAPAAQAAVPAPASAPGSGAASPAPPGADGISQPFETDLVEAGAGPAGGPRGYNGYAHSFAGMGVQFILLLGVDMGIGLLLLRRQDLWKRLRAAPLSRAMLLGSRLCSAALIAFALFAAILGVGMAIFQVRVLGSGAGLLAVLAAFALLTASFGLMIAALGRSPDATRGLSIMATLLLVMLGGAWVPAFLFPAWLQELTLALPTRWAVDALDAMTWRGLGLDAALPAVAVLLGFALLCALVAWWRFGWDE